MPVEFCLETERLMIRPWRGEDLEPFAEICADPDVMRFFPSPLTKAKTAKLIENCERTFDQYGYFYAPIELKTTRELVGFAGLDKQDPDDHHPFTPCVDIGWRLKRSAWGKGYASEAARAWLRFGFETIGLTEIVAFTPHSNIPSQNVMKRIGMTHNPADDFKHLFLDPDHELALHCLYRISNSEWTAQLQSGRRINVERFGQTRL